MPTFVISYDLNKQKNYPKLWEELRRLGCIRALDSVWIGNIKATAQTLVNHLSPFVDQDDSLLVAETDASKVAFKRPYEGTKEWVQQQAK